MKNFNTFGQFINEAKSNEDLLSMLRDYISADYTADQGYGGDEVKAREDMKRI